MLAGDRTDLDEVEVVALAVAAFCRFEQRLEARTRRRCARDMGRVAAREKVGERDRACRREFVDPHGAQESERRDVCRCASRQCIIPGGESSAAEQGAGRRSDGTREAAPGGASAGAGHVAHSRGETRACVFKNVITRTRSTRDQQSTTIGPFECERRGGILSQMLCKTGGRFSRR